MTIIYTAHEVHVTIGFKLRPCRLTITKAIEVQRTRKTDRFIRGRKTSYKIIVGERAEEEEEEEDG